MNSASNSNPHLGVEAARRRLPELVRRAAAGERIVISRHHQPLAALVPLTEPQPLEPANGPAQIQALIGLQGSGQGCWSSTPAPAEPSSFVQPLRRQPAFDLRSLNRGCRVALDGSALVAFLRDGESSQSFVGPLIRGIAEGYWQGVMSTVSLMRVLEGPLACGDEQLAQRYASTFANGGPWELVAPDRAITVAAVRLRQQEPQLNDTNALELATAIHRGALVLVTDNPTLAQTGQHPVLSSLRF